MKQIIILLFLTTLLGLCDQFAITDNDIKVILKDDGTWHTADPVSGEVTLFAATEDSQIVFLKDDGTWEYVARDSLIEIIPYYKIDKKPKPIYTPIPVYPESARQAGVEGNVVVKCLLDIDGSVMDVKILKSSGDMLLDIEALNAARKAKFEPAMHRGKPVRVYVSIPYKFRIKGCCSGCIFGR